ncbi:aspartate/glutamate racemase family protein [Roseicyclus marinus]|uniref:aspartate/glutamate racemase family protein n=1 Tax=Roseicyclus marinus TaxID=2161673 RepID=UPI00240F0C2F|nr:aspartate/glutamate racemase family protein [Roseicyclus marinus]MDG3041009.1 aspartate/glutamate racemase family protein [Roseicyclus marinus]
MRLLIVNPNTSTGVTARIDRAAQAVARPGDRFTTISAAFGPSLIVTEDDGRAATQGVLAAVARHPGPVEGVILASFGDTGAEELRAARPDLAVIGIAEAAFARTADIGGPFAIVTFAPEVAGPLGDKALALGHGDRLLGIAHPPAPLCHDPAEVAEALLPDLRQLCIDAAAGGAHSIILGGGPLAGLSARIAPHCPVPVIDGTQAAIDSLRRRLHDTQPRAATQA